MLADVREDHDQLPPGVYDVLITRELAARIKGGGLQPQWEDVDDAAQPDMFARHLARLARTRLAGSDASERVELFNRMAAEIAGDEHAIDEPRRLIALRAGEQLGVEQHYRELPSLPVGEPALITNAKEDPSVGHEIRSELHSADRVDLLCAFIKWSGVRTMDNELREIRRRGSPLRVITSTYLGATEAHALDKMVRDYGAEVKVNYEVDRTRLHAKAWLFTRNSRFDTAYVGSSNLSVSALLDGVEWNVRLTRAATPTLIDKFGVTFETYWNDDRFEVYDPARDAERLRHALREAGTGRVEGRETITLSGLEVRPYPHQVQILEDLEVERTVQNRHRNLIVAATGTGKTVVAALDYKRLCADAKRPLKLLFVAHRQEILAQARAKYREVLSDANFGELWVAGQRPVQWQQVFASVQSLNVSDITNFAPDAFEVIVIDEFHHAAAPSYRKLLTHFQPGELLGLTATPERTDGFDVQDFFDGRMASEIRLWDALKADLLCPFHYFGLHDGTDLSGVSWQRGSYDIEQLSSLYTGNDARARIVLKQLADKVPDSGQMRALGFCVGVAHAQYMARVFNSAGIPAVALSGETPQDQRHQAIEDLRTCKINAIFTADLFNEGVDLPDIDTLLFLRPTESATLFLQQLGRGLRRIRDKAVLTVLDFVGNQNVEFRYDKRFTAMTGIPRGQLSHHIEHKFPFLPSGCQIILDRQSTELILANVERQVVSRWRDVVSQLRAIGDVSLGDFLKQGDIDLVDVIKQWDKSWVKARLEARVPVPSEENHDAKLLRRGRAVAHVDDPHRLSMYRFLLSDRRPSYDDLDSEQQRFARMLLYSIWPKLAEPYSVALERLRADQRSRFELREILDCLSDGIRHIPRPLQGHLSQTGLVAHARYSREEILAALDYAKPARLPGNFREGVLWSDDWKTDAFLVTLNKSESEFAPSTMYSDYAISPTLFHWESQSSTTVASPTGRRYLNQRKTKTSVVIFSRERRAWEFGKGAPYLLLGTANYVSHSGEAPIAITWKLDIPMPNEHFQAATAVETG